VSFLFSPFILSHFWIFQEGNNAVGGEDATDAADKELDTHKARRKRAKLEAVVGPAVDKGASHEAAGVKSINIIPRAAPIKKNKPVMEVSFFHCTLTDFIFVKVRADCPYECLGNIIMFRVQGLISFNIICS
jgi:hypothetical protein